METNSKTSSIIVNKCEGFTVLLLVLLLLTHGSVIRVVDGYGVALFVLKLLLLSPPLPLLLLLLLRSSCV